MPIKVKNADDIKSKLGQVVYLVGTQWGDEGKGKLADIISEKYDIIARAAGGANAGHTICINHEEVSKKYIFHLLPSGALHVGKICIIGNGTVIHIPTLLDEMHSLREHGIEIRDNLFISDRAHLIFDYHLQADSAQEDRKGVGKVGTTKRGIGPAYEDKIARRGIRAGDLLNFGYFVKKLRANAERYMKEYGFETDIEKEINVHKDAIQMIEGMIINTSEYLDKAYKEGKTIVAEGAQGTQLDIDFGTYPYVTSSNTISGGACTGLGIAPNKINTVLGIVKAYTTRVGEGPFPTELSSYEGEMLQEHGSEFGASTGRPRRCGWFDAMVVKEAIMLNGITSINLTKLDVLINFQTIKIGVGYKLNGDPITSMPLSQDLGSVEVQYEEMPGWNEDISKAKTFKDLPKNAQKYVKRLEEILEVPINFIGVGVHRDEMIFR
ncbi:adenylosuccinate synthase [Patescibacteria group bacterium]|nr:adenylosuccinate synthase [Patescibacteria group bacterium]